MKKKKEPEKQKVLNLADGHYMGKHTGYDVRDGKIYPAPALTDIYHSIQDRRRGLDRYLETVNLFIAQQYEQLAKEERLWWQKLAEDLRLDYSTGWIYDYLDKSIRRVKETPAKAK